MLKRRPLSNYSQALNFSFNIIAGCVAISIIKNFFKTRQVGELTIYFFKKEKKSSAHKHHLDIQS
jgi:hypothetical protein